MKKISLLAMALLILTSCMNAQKNKFSDKALATSVIALDGSEVKFSDILNKHKGKNVVIEIWASWCGDCVKAMPKLKELQKDNSDVDFIFVSMDKAADKWKAGIEKHSLEGDHYWANDGMKGNFGAAADVDWIPRYIVVDKSGKVVLYRAIETDFEKIDSTLKTLR